MKCESVRELADLYLYGELESQQEEEFEQHLHQCAACQSAVDRVETLHRGFDSVRLTPPPDMIVECRRSLFHSPKVERKPSPWINFSEAWRALWSTWYARFRSIWHRCG